MGEIIGGLMMLGAVLGGATSSVISSTNGINNACNELDNANNTYNSTKEQWSSVIEEEYANVQITEKLNKDLNSQYSTYKSALQSQIKLHKSRKLQMDIFAGVFIVVLILILLLKYFKVYKLIWSFFVKK